MLVSELYDVAFKRLRSMVTPLAVLLDPVELWPPLRTAMLELPLHTLLSVNTVSAMATSSLV